MPNHDCWGPAVYTISDRKGNVGGREGGNERLEKGVQWGKERNSFWGDIWLWLRGAVWTSQPLPLVLTGLFLGGSWCCLFLNSKWLVNWWTRAMDTMTKLWLGFFNISCVYPLVCAVWACPRTSILCICGNGWWLWGRLEYIQSIHFSFLRCRLCNALWCKDMSYIC